MKRERRMPTIEFGSYTTYDTLGSLLNGWVATVVTADGSTYEGEMHWDGNRFTIEAFGEDGARPTVVNRVGSSADHFLDTVTLIEIH